MAKNQTKIAGGSKRGSNKVAPEPMVGNINQSLISDPSESETLDGSEMNSSEKESKN